MGFSGKRIFMVAPTPFFSERGCHVRVLDSYLRHKDENDLTLFTYGLGRTPAQVEKIVRVFNFPWYKKTSPGPSITKIFYDFLLFSKMFWHSLHERPDVYYCHLHEGAAVGLALRAIFGGKVLFDNQGLLVGELSNTRLGKLARPLTAIEGYLLRHVDFNVVSSEGLRQKILARYAIDTVTQPDIPNPKIFDPKVPPARIALPKGKTIVVYLGGLQKGKGMDEFLRVIPHLDKRFFFLIMGYPVDHCKEIADDLGIQDRVMFTGPIKYEESPAYLKLGSYALSPKKTESGEANAKLYTYRAMGLKTVCYDAPENRAILGKLGVYVKGQSIDAFKHAFKRLR